jgi:hypothetical protein
VRVDAEQGREQTDLYVRVDAEQSKTDETILFPLYIRIAFVFSRPSKGLID